MLKLRDLETILLGSPDGQKMLKAQADRTLQERARSVAAILAAEEAEAKALPGLKRAIDQALDRYGKARREAVAAEEQVRARVAEEQQVRNTADAVRRREHARLRETASPRIRAEMDRLMDEWEAKRHTLTAQHSGGGERLVNGGRSPATHSTLPSIRAHMAALLEASRAVEALTYEAIPEDELEARFAAIRATVPDPDVMVAL